MLALTTRRLSNPTTIRASRHFVARSFSTGDSISKTLEDNLSPGDNVIVPLIANSLEFALSSPPPLHQFIESPLVVETDHLTLYTGMECEEVLAEQGHEVTDIIGKEKWIVNDAEKYEGLIPQNAEWTEFIDEKTGETVILDDFGDRVENPVRLHVVKDVASGEEAYYDVDGYRVDESGARLLIPEDEKNLEENPPVAKV